MILKDIPKFERIIILQYLFLGIKKERKIEKDLRTL